MSREILAAKIAGFGLFMHGVSDGIMRNGMGIFPTPTGKLNGNKGPITWNGTSIGARWSEIVANGYASDEREQSTIGRKFLWY